MSLSASLGVVTQSLAEINLGFGVISNNIANAATNGYATETAEQKSLDAGGQGEGVFSAPTQLVSDAALQSQVFGENAATGAATTTDTALASLQPVAGTVGTGNDLGSLLGALQNTFSALLTDPSNQAQQGSVVSAAQGVTAQINALSNSYGSARQAAQNALVSQVGQLNTALGQVGTLSTQIESLQAQGASTADLQNQRNAVLTTISGLVDARFAPQPNGDMLVFTAGGAQLPTDSATALAITAATTGPTAYYPGGGLPGITLGGTDITGALTGGAIGANVTLRDTTLPAYQGEVDEFASTLANRFSAQGLTLFSDPQGLVPAGGGTPAQTGYVGFASVITVNPAVAASPSLVRDGTQAVAGSPTGASAFTPNPNNLAGFTDLINRVLNFSLGADAQAGVTQAAPNVTGLGPAGTLAAPFAAPATLADFATGITASQAADANTADTAASDANGVQSSLAGSLKSTVGVDVDSQLALMVQLQNAYGANAKIISTIASMFNTLLTDLGG